MLYLYFKAKPNRKSCYVAANMNKLSGFYKHITDDFCRDFIKAIDDTEVVNENIVNSAILGYILPENLSGGSQSLLLLYASDDYFVYASQLGGNCLKWLYKLSTIKDVHMVMDYMITAEYDDIDLEDEFNAIVVDDGLVVHTYKEYCYRVLSFRYRKDIDLDPE